MKILVVEPQKTPYEKEINGDLKSLQNEVGGFVEAVYPYDDPVAIVCNEEGKMIGLDLNRALYGEDGQMYDIVAGTFFITGLGESDFASLSQELMEKYRKKFYSPEIFVWEGDNLKPIKMISDKQSERAHKPLKKRSEPER